MAHRRVFNPFYRLSNTLFIGVRLSLQILYLSKSNLSLHSMTSRHDRPGFSDSSISPDGQITLESYIFGYDIIHNSSINSTSHFLSVSPTFLTILPPSPLFFLSVSLIVHRSYVCHVIASRYISLPCPPFTCLTLHRCGPGMIYRVIQCAARSIDCLSEGGDLSGGDVVSFDASAF